VVSVVSFVALRKVFKKNSDVKRLAEDDINQY